MNKGKERENSQPAESGEPDMDVNQMVRFDLSQNEEIFTEEQKEYIISKFPKKLHEYLNKVNNPLDETQVIISLLKEKNIRIVLTYEENMFGVYEWKGNYHATDIADIMKYSDISNWSRRWNIKFKTFGEISEKNEVRQIDGLQPLMNFDKKIVKSNVLFIDDEGLKTILLKTTKKGKEIDLFKEWIIKYSTIAKSVISMVIQIKKDYEIEQKNYEIEQKDKIIRQIEENKQKEINEMRIRIEKAVGIYPLAQKQKGYVYIVQSELLKSKGLVRIGRTLNIERRENQYKCADPTYAVEYYRDVEDKMLTEKAIHYILNNIRKYSNREFFYCSSLDEMKEIVNRCVDLIEELIVDQEEIIKEIRRKYMDGEITELIEEEEETKEESKDKIIKRERTKSPAKRTPLQTNSEKLLNNEETKQIEYINNIDEVYDESSSSNKNLICNKNNDCKEEESLNKNLICNTYNDCKEEDYRKFVEKEIIKVINFCTLYKKYVEWCIKNKITNIPNENIFMENIKKQNCEMIKINNIEHVIKKKDNNMYEEYFKKFIIETDNNFDYIIGSDLRSNFELWIKRYKPGNIYENKTAKQKFNELFKEDEKVISSIPDVKSFRGWRKYKMVNINSNNK